MARLLRDLQASAGLVFLLGKGPPPCLPLNLKAFAAVCHWRGTMTPCMLGTARFTLELDCYFSAECKAKPSVNSPSPGPHILPLRLFYGHGRFCWKTARRLVMCWRHLTHMALTCYFFLGGGSAIIPALAFDEGLQLTGDHHWLHKTARKNEGKTTP